MSILDELDEFFQVGRTRLTEKVKIRTKDKDKKYCPRCKKILLRSKFYESKRANIMQQKTNSRQPYCIKCLKNKPMTKTNKADEV